jgi:hypothetical protein
VKIFSNAIYKIDNAICGFTIAGCGLMMLNMNKPSVTVLATVNAVDCYKIDFNLGG